MLYISNGQFRVSIKYTNYLGLTLNSDNNEVTVFSPKILRGLLWPLVTL